MRRRSRFDVGYQPTPYQFLRDKPKSLSALRMANSRVAANGMAHSRSGSTAQSEQEDDSVGSYAFPSLREMAYREFARGVRRLAGKLTEAAWFR
jgi:hypothetical protein